MKDNPFPTHLMNRLSGILFPLLLLYALTACTPVVSEDYVVYTVGDYSDSGLESHLMLYDPGTDNNTPLLPEWQIETINLGANNRLAFSSSHEGKSFIYVLDYPFASSTPRDITPNSDAEKRLYGWSRDGRYLAYEAAQMDQKMLFVWDGKSSRAIYDIKSVVGSLDWSADGRLAFTELHYFVRGTDQEIQDDSEVFVWDGADVRSVSQNPSGSDQFPRWSNDGKLAFVSERDDAWDIYIWDGKSTLDGAPDVRTFINVAPDLTGYESSPVWTDSGYLLTGYQGSEERACQSRLEAHRRH